MLCITDTLLIHNWCFDNYLYLQLGKTKLVVCCRKLAVKLEDFQELTPASSAKDIQVPLNPYLDASKYSKGSK